MRTPKPRKARKPRNGATRDRGAGGLIHMEGCRYWYAQYYKDGKRYRESTKTEVKQEAEAILRKKMGDSERGITPASDLKKIRYGHLRRSLLDDYARLDNKSLQTLADGTETVWGLKALDEFFGYKPGKEAGEPPKELGKSVASITTDAVRAFTKKRRSEGVGNAIINRSLAALRRMLNLARQEGKVSSTPWIPMLKEPPARQGFLTDENFKKIIAELPDELRPLITFLFYCGCRLGEAKQIQWSQVDLTAALIRLEDVQTKSGDSRYIPLPDVLVKMLESLPREGAVFCARNLRKAWIKACVKTGLGRQDDEGHYSGLILHDLRRSAIKFLMESGATESEAMKISGHKTNAIFKRYNIVTTQDVTNVMRRREALPGKNGQNTVKSEPSGEPQKQLNY